MNNEKNNEKNSEIHKEQRAPQGAGPEAGAAEPAFSRQPNQEQAPGAGDALEALQAENAELKDKVLRAMAEMENMRRRTEREKAEFQKYAISEFARHILVIGDNVRRAIDAVPKEAVASDPALRTLLEGVEVTERELLKVLERHNIKRFDPRGERFDPHRHEAMMKAEMPNVPPDTVIQVLHAGYMIGERVLRPAAVIIAQGGAPAAQGQASAGPSPNSAPSGSQAPVNGARAPADSRDEDVLRRLRPHHDAGPKAPGNSHAGRQRPGSPPAPGKNNPQRPSDSSGHGNGVHREDLRPLHARPDLSALFGSRTPAPFPEQRAKPRGDEPASPPGRRFNINNSDN